MSKEAFTGFPDPHPAPAFRTSFSDPKPPHGWATLLDYESVIALRPHSPNRKPLPVERYRFDNRA